MDRETINEYQSHVERTSDIVTIIDERGEVLFQSPSVTRILGYDPGRLVSDSTFDYVHPADRARVRTWFDAVTESSDSAGEEVTYRFRHADDSWVWLESTMAHTPNASECDVIVSRDVSRRKQYECELAEEHEKYATIVDRSHDGIAIVQDDRFAFVNERFAAIHGYAEDELLGVPFLHLVAPEDRAEVREEHGRRTDPDAASPPLQGEAQFLTKDGETRVGGASFAQIKYEGEPATLLTLRDVTDRRCYETQLKKTTEELEALNRLIRHDIRNDIGIILGWAELLDGHVDESGEQFLRKILSSGEHIVELTEIAREYVEMLTTDGEVEIEPVPLRSVLQTELDLRRESFPEATFSVVGGVPDVEVVANDMLGAVFRNLLTNAVQHNDGDEPAVEVSCDVQADNVVVHIADDGPGVPDDQKDAIFGKNERGLDSPGTGIGLYLVRSLVDQYDGCVWVEDNDPRGAVFNVRLLKAPSS